MKRHLLVFATIIMMAPFPAHAGWTSGTGPIGKTMDCINPLGFENCILREQPKSKRSARYYYNQQRQMYQQLDNYTRSRLVKPPRTMTDPRVK